MRAAFFVFLQSLSKSDDHKHDEKETNTPVSVNEYQIAKHVCTRLLTSNSLELISRYMEMVLFEHRMKSILKWREKAEVWAQLPSMILIKEIYETKEKDKHPQGSTIIIKYDIINVPLCFMSLSFSLFITI